ncbi:MAG: histone H1 [Betaproteobacteria bacterium]|nr:MAG: histone H1 [Betaproteobacteria bacterium]
MKCYPTRMPRKDLNTAAFAVMQQATGEVVPEPIGEKKKAAQESGRRGGLKGGTARAATLTPEQRSEIAKKAAAKRWDAAK